MEEKEGARVEPAQTANTVEAVYGALAERVRADSKNRARLTHWDSLAALAPEPQKLSAVVTAMTLAPGYEDIRVLVAAHGVRFVYSDLGLSRSQAEKFALGDEVRVRIAGRVREDSGRFRLTAVSGLGALIPGAEPDKIDGHLALLADCELYPDVRMVANSRGERFLYSDAAMTRNYAEILARAEAKDPCGTMAATIREDSQLYPRPTRLDVFAEPAFGINAADLDRLAGELAGRPEYADIKLVRASNGVAYFYSDRYLDPEWVKANVEWEEVGRQLNP